jgi:uncharacterized membrane protein
VTWAAQFRARQYLKGSLWVLPLVGGVAGLLLGLLDLGVEEVVTTPWEFSASTADTLLAAIIGAMVGLTGFVVTVTVLMVQMATGMFSARYMRLWYRDRLLKLVLALLLLTLTFSFTLLTRVEEGSVPNLGVTIAGVLVVASLGLFMLFLDEYIHRLRPVAVAALVARRCVRAVEENAATTTRPARAEAVAPGPGVASDVVPSPRAGTIQAVHVAGLVDWADRHDCVLVLRHAVGDFVPAGEPLIEIHGAAGSDGRELAGMVALGDERTIEQDPGFALRILVDIALMALSPAVNAPTTAVQVLDYLEETLRLIGTIDLEEQSERWDGEGRLRLVIPTPGWDDYLALGVTEIRLYGASAIQVLRRLRALLEALRSTVRPEYRAAVEAELRSLEASVEQRFPSSVDLDRASLADRQGIGGPQALGR